jgi:hypothetical protein
MSEKGQDIRHLSAKDKDIVFDKSIFSSIFDKDVRRVYIYKRAERLASALYLISPAFRDSVSLRSRVEAVAVTLTEAASLPGTRLTGAFSRELLSLSSLLAMGEAAGLLSSMNADLIIREAQSLLAEVTLYEEPRLTLAEPTSLAALTRQAGTSSPAPRALPASTTGSVGTSLRAPGPKGHTSIRQESILAFIKGKENVSIKDLTRVIRGVSEKTIQRELQGLIESGQVAKRGDRRWTTYAAI